jgi:glycerol-3-phosphate cytidylyltransferase
MTIGYVPGGFDMFHVGHLNILKTARTRCDTLIVGVASDESLYSMKGRYPVVPQLERMAIVSALACVDRVVLDLSIDKRLAWAENSFDLLFKGDDWRGTTKGAVLEQDMAEVGVRVEYFPYTAHTSSTMLRRFIEGKGAVA